MEKRIFVICILMLFIFVGTVRAGEAGRQVVSSVIVKVGTENVTLSGLRAFMALSDSTILREYLEGRPLKKEMAKLVNDAVSYLVTRKLLLVAAWEKKDEIEYELSRLAGARLTLPERPASLMDFAKSAEGRKLTADDIAEREKRHGNRASYIEELKKYGVTLDQVRAALLEGLIVQVLLYRVETVDKFVSPEETRKYFEEHPDEFSGTMQYTVRHIFVSKKTRPGDEGGERVKLALKRVGSGEDFAAVARELSDGQHRGLGGQRQWNEKDEIPAEILKTMRELDAGQRSGIIETGDGFHIIKLEEKKRVGAIPFEQAADKIKNAVISKRRQKTQAELVEKTRKNIKIIDYRKPMRRKKTASPGF
jgi:parvulin-like peptidyl-prolyl isomerase